MRSHAKASTAGSTQRQAGRLGRIFRGALATRGASLDSKGSGAPRVGRLVLPAAILALVLVGALAVTPASALKFHAFKEVFGSAAQPSLEAGSIAIDQPTGDVLVMDATGGNYTVKRFNSDGTPDNFSALGTNVIDGEAGADTTPQNGLSFGGSSESQIAVDNSGTATDGNIYVTQSSPRAINVFAGTGAYLGQLTAAGATNFTRACGVAVDPSGALYVGDRNTGIRKFVPTANPPVNTDHTATFTSVSQPCPLAVGAGPTAGFLFAATLSGAISKLDIATGELKYTVVSGSHKSVAVDPGTGRIFGLTLSAIEEFDASGAASATAVSNTPVGIMQGLAVRGSTGDIYSWVSTSDKIQVLSGAVSTAPDVTTTAATGVGATTATLNGTVNPDGLGLSECKFEYGKTTAYGQSVPCAESTASIGSGTSPVAVHADVSGLDPNGATYNFRLVATNPEASRNGANQTLSTLGPVIVDTWAEDVTITEAVLKAEINPKGSATTYRFEYGTSTAYGNETTELNVGSDSSAHTVQLPLSELQPGTAYHYRVVATNGDAVNEGPDREIRTFKPFSAESDCPNQANRYGASASLPDCRAYEMVSPVDKNNGDVKALLSAENSWPARRTKSTPSGDRLTYSSATAFGGVLSAPIASQYIAQRQPGQGWETHAINPPQSDAILFGLEAVRPQYFGFSDDLCHGWMNNFGDPSLSPAGLTGAVNIYRRNDRLCGPEGFEAVGPIATPMGEGLDSFSFLGASADGSHAIFVSGKKLTSEGSEGTEFGPIYQLYESVGPEAMPRLVCILPNEEPWEGACAAGSGTEAVAAPLLSANLTGAISEDGEQIFWSDTVGAGQEGRLYVRIGGAETVPVSQAGEALAGTTGSFFWGAAPDGSRTVYTTGEVPNSHLFAFDVDDEATEPIAEGVRGVMGMSEDARRVYFVSNKAIPGSGQNSEGAEALEGQRNLYLYDADQGGGTTTFIATLANQDVAEARRGPVGREPIQHTSRVTPDGRYAAFESFASLTAYDNKGGTTGSLNNVAYVYDAASGELICASCIPSGARGQSEVAATGAGNLQLEVIRTFENALLPLRVLSPGRLFFQSINALTPRDSNGRVDVYEWEQLGVGGCDVADSAYAPSAEGCISLISSGKSSVNSEFAEASASGDDVFFYTISSLVPQDFGRRDIYDARASGGFPLPPEAPECVGDACQSIPAAPNDPTPASAGFRGAGDPAPRKAQRRRCRARIRQGARGSKAKQKKAKRCRRNNRRAGR